MGTTLTPFASSVTTHKTKVRKINLPLHPMFITQSLMPVKRMTTKASRARALARWLSSQDAFNPSSRSHEALTCRCRSRYGLMRVECSTNESTARLPYILTYSNLAVRIPLVYKTFRRAGAGGHWSRAACGPKVKGAGVAPSTCRGGTPGSADTFAIDGVR